MKRNLHDFGNASAEGSGQGVFTRSRCLYCWLESATGRLSGSAQVLVCVSEVAGDSGHQSGRHLQYLDRLQICLPMCCSAVLGDDVDTIASVLFAQKSGYTISGSVSGLQGTLVVQYQRVDVSKDSKSSTNSFTAAITDASTYLVTVQFHPSGQACHLVNGAGMVSAEAMRNISISCASNH